jgi:hypothetical protein
MPPRRRTPRESSGSLSRPAATPQERENQLIYLASELAEKQLRDGSASAQVVTHYLKLGSSRERLEQMKLEHENELLRVKKESIEQAGQLQELYANAMRAFGTYNGSHQPGEDELYED